MIRHQMKHVLAGLSSIGLAMAASAAAIGGIGGSAALAAAPRKANPSNLGAILQAARGGERIVLAAGDYGFVKFPRKNYSPALQIDARQARFTGILIQGVAGVAITGGVVDGPRDQHAAVGVDSSHDIQIRGMHTSGSQDGISVTRSQHVVVADNVFDGMASDGVQVAVAQDVRIERNVCRNFHPTPATYDARGKIVQDGNHPDCIQGWSVPGQPSLANLTIIGNSGSGPMQGIFIGNKQPGSIDGIVVRDNTFDLSAYNGIVIMGARNGRISHNVVRTIPGARAGNYPFRPITAWIKADVTGGVVVCGNSVDDRRHSDDHGPCKDGLP